ncbi:MAG TPA: hypothetical protein VFW77_03315 [Candidatus Saccharimonadales bacterium]|nr:hypothetical protein [Candidatus Saccharimonadales bacterium]
MRELYKEPAARPESQKHGLKSKLLLKVIGGAAVLSLLPAAIAGAHGKEPSAKHKSPAAKVADRLERKIERHPAAKVSFDATHDLFWGQTEKGIFRFKTEVPLTGRVGARHVLRYFGIKNEGDSRQDIDVYPIPADALRAQTIYDGFYHDGTDPNSRGTLQMDPKTHKLTTLLTYANGDPSVRVNVGDTSHYDSSVVIPPPPVPPGPIGGPPLPPGYSAQG